MAFDGFDLNGSGLWQGHTGWRRNVNSMKNSFSSLAGGLLQSVFRIDCVARGTRSNKNTPVSVSLLVRSYRGYLLCSCRSENEILNVHLAKVCVCGAGAHAVKSQLQQDNIAFVFDLRAFHRIAAAHIARRHFNRNCRLVVEALYSTLQHAAGEVTGNVR